MITAALETATNSDSSFSPSRKPQKTCAKRLMAIRFQLYFFATFLQLSQLVSSQTTSIAFNLTSTWMAGSSTGGKAAVYGTPGIASATADPGSRNEACGAMSYVGPDSFIMFGGDSGSYMGDLWSFDVATAWWTTLHISKTQSFGTQGVPSSTTFPGVKYWHACAMSPFDNQFYLFGGWAGTGSLRENNMWSYNFSLKQWTFLKGNSAPGTYTTYGVSAGVGIEAPSNLPAGRQMHSLNAMTSTASFIMFAGSTYYPTYVLLNDLWRYNCTSNNWALLSGSITASVSPVVYGTTGVFSSTSVPAGVWGHATSFSPNTDLLYVFGGYSTTWINELWVFDCSLSQWAFMSSGTQLGVYTVGSQYPGGRYGDTFIAIPNTPLFIMVS